MTDIAARGTPMLNAAVLAALIAGGSFFAPVPAAAQFFGGGGWFNNFGPPPMVEPDGVVPLRVVARILHSRGFRLTDVPARRGGRLYALAVDDYGRLSSVVLDAYSGTLLRAGPVAAERPVGDIDGPLARPKPRVRTAARPPVAPLPGAAPASPPPLPSQAITTPAITTPVVPPAAVVAPPAVPAAPSNVTPPTNAALPARPAPDAQPADIGPKVVPVKPTGEAKAPPPPADYDTEAGPRARTVTPEEANRMAPEQHKDE